MMSIFDFKSSTVIKPSDNAFIPLMSSYICVITGCTIASSSESPYFALTAQIFLNKLLYNVGINPESVIQPLSMKFELVKLIKLMYLSLISFAPLKYDFLLPLRYCKCKSTSGAVFRHKTISPTFGVNLFTSTFT